MPDDKTLTITLESASEVLSKYLRKDINIVQVIQAYQLAQLCLINTSSQKQKSQFELLVKERDLLGQFLKSHYIACKNDLELMKELNFSC